MPPSRLVGYLRFGESGYLALNPVTRERVNRVTAKFADHLVDRPLAIRIELNDSGIRVYPFLDTRPSRIDL